MQNVLKRKNMYFVKKSIYQKHLIKKLMFYTILDLLICISENVKKKSENIFWRFPQKTVFAVRGGGAERYGQRIGVFYAFPKRLNTE